VRENRTHGSEGGEDGVLLYPYRNKFLFKNFQLKLGYEFGLPGVA
jgi:hypothetical protein